MKRVATLLTLILALIFIVNSASAFTQFPHEDCNTWTTISTDTIIGSPGCYVVTAPVTLGLSTGGTVVIDLNHVPGVTFKTSLYVFNVEFMNGNNVTITFEPGPDEDLFGGDGNIYLFNIYGASSVIYARKHGLTLVRAQDVNVGEFKLLTFGMNDRRKVELNNVEADYLAVYAYTGTFTNVKARKYALIVQDTGSAGTITFTNVSLPFNTIITMPINNIINNGMTIGGLPVVINPTSVQPGYAYLFDYTTFVNVRPITGVDYVAITNTTGTELSLIEANYIAIPANPPLLYAWLPGTIGKVKGRLVSTPDVTFSFYSSFVGITVDNSFIEIYGSKKIEVPVEGSISFKATKFLTDALVEITDPYGSLFVSLESYSPTSTAQTVFQAKTLLFNQIFSNTTKEVAVFGDAYSYLPVLKVNNIEFNHTSAKIAKFYLLELQPFDGNKIRLYMHQAPSQTNKLTVEFRGVKISDLVDYIEINKSGTQQFEVYFNDVIAEGNVTVTCADPSIKVVLGGLTDPSKFNVVGCTLVVKTWPDHFPSETCVSWTSIYSYMNPMPIGFPGCYRVEENGMVIELYTDFNTIPASVVIDLNGHTINELRHTVNAFYPLRNVLIDVTNGTISGHMYLIPRGDDNNVKLALHDIITDIVRLEMTYLNHLKIDNAQIKELIFDLYTQRPYTPQPRTVEINNSTLAAVAISASDITIANSTITTAAKIVLTPPGIGTLELSNTSLPKITSITADINDIVVNNTTIDGVPLEVNPTTLAPGGAYLVGSFTGPVSGVHYLGITDPTQATPLILYDINVSILSLPINDPSLPSTHADFTNVRADVIPAPRSRLYINYANNSHFTVYGSITLINSPPLNSYVAFVPLYNLGLSTYFFDTFDVYLDMLATGSTFWSSGILYLYKWYIGSGTKLALDKLYAYELRIGLPYGQEATLEVNHFGSSLPSGRVMMFTTSNVRFKGTTIDTNYIDIYQSGEAVGKEVNIYLEDVTATKQVTITCGDPTIKIYFEGTTNPSNITTVNCTVEYNLNWNVWPDEICYDWNTLYPTVVSGTTYVEINSGGCYRLASDVNEIRLLPMNVEFLVLDLNGHSVEKIIFEQETVIRRAFEVFNGYVYDITPSSYTSEICNYYVRDINLGYRIYAYLGSTLNCEYDRLVRISNVTGSYAGPYDILTSMIYIQGSPSFNMQVEINDTTIERLYVYYPNGGLMLNNVEVTEYAHFLRGNSISMVNVRLPLLAFLGFDPANIVELNNVTIAGVPLEVNPSTILPTGAYLTTDGNISDINTFYLAIYALDDVNMSNVSVNGLSLYTYTSYPTKKVNLNNVRAGSVVGIFKLGNVINSYLNGWKYAQIAFDNSYIENSEIMGSFIGLRNVDSKNSSIVVRDMTDSFLGDVTVRIDRLTFTDPSQSMYATVYGFYGYRLLVTSTEGNLTLDVNVFEINAPVPKEYKFFLFSYYSPSKVNFTLENATIRGINKIGIYTYPPSPTFAPSETTFTFRDVWTENSIELVCEVPATIILEGTTPAWKFYTNDSNCTIIDNTTGLNLTVDLAFQDVNTDTAKYEENKEFNVLITVHSSGAPSSNVPVKLVVTDYKYFTYEYNYTIPYIDFNSSYTIVQTLSLPSSPYRYAIYAIVDHTNSLPENNETDNTSNYLYADIVRFIDSCGTLTTGHYEVNTDMNDITTDPCWSVQTGETAKFTVPSTYSVYGASIFTTLFNVPTGGTLILEGTIGQGKLYNTGTTIINANQIPNHKLNIWTSGDLTINSDLNIGVLAHFDGRITINGSPTIIHYDYNPLSFSATPAWQLIINGDLFIRNYATDGNVSRVYVDQSVSDPTGTYVYFYTLPVFDAVDEVTYLIVTNGLDFELFNKKIHSIQVNAKLGDSTEANFYNITLDTSLLLDNQPNHYNNGPRHVIKFTDSTLTPTWSSVRYTDLYLTSTTYTPLHVGMWDVYIYIENSTIETNDLYGTGPLVIEANLENSPSTVYLNPVSYEVNFICHGNQYLYVLPSMIDSNYVDLSDCLVNIDYNRNFTISVTDIPPYVPPDKDYNITVVVTSTAELAPVTVDVAAFLDGVLTSTKTVTLAPGETKTLTFTFHSTPEAGAQQIEFVVDPDNVYPETNEQDNVAVAEIIVETPPTTAVIKTGGGGPVTAASTVYVSANLNEEKEAYLHVFWKYPYESKAYLFYYSVNGEISGPEVITLKPGDNIIKIKVKPYKYGLVGKVVVKTITYREEISVYARPLASLYPVDERLMKAVLLAILLLGALAFFVSRKS